MQVFCGAHRVFRINEFSTWALSNKPNLEHFILRKEICTESTMKVAILFLLSRSTWTFQNNCISNMKIWLIRAKLEPQNMIQDTYSFRMSCI